MNKQEFEEKINAEVSEKDYEVIEKVYTWHPAISNTTGKMQIAQIFLSGGMMVIRSMEEVADLMISLDKEKSELRAKIQRLDERVERVNSGDVNYEKVRRQLQIAFDNSDDAEQFQSKVCVLADMFDRELVIKVRSDMKI